MSVAEPFLQLQLPVDGSNNSEVCVLTDTYMFPTTFPRCPGGKPMSGVTVELTSPKVATARDSQGLASKNCKSCDQKRGAFTIALVRLEAEESRGRQQIMIPRSETTGKGRTSRSYHTQRRYNTQASARAQTDGEREGARARSS